MTKDLIAPPFEDFRNIEVGKARVIFAPAIDYRPAGWVLPGGLRTDNRDEAYACAVAMNRLMGGVQVISEPVMHIGV